MKSICFIITMLTICNFGKAQTYFPPNSGNVWDTMSPSNLGWCPEKIDSLYAYLDQQQTKAFIVLKDGKIVLEKYFDTFTADSIHLWNSAGKTLLAFTLGIAQQENYLDITDTTSTYLGTGWTNLTPTQEEKITIYHQLAMNSGLDDSGDLDCTTPSCLNYLAEPGDRWSYHNAPYTLLHNVIDSAVGMTVNMYINQKISSITGINGIYYPLGSNKVFISTPRSFARFGLLLSQNGTWNGTPVLSDQTYFQQMINSAQSINPSYGFLTWLNGKSSFMLPQIQFSFSGPLLPNAPSDAYAAVGKDGQIINVVPSQNLVLIRMGDDVTTSLAPVLFNDTIWQKMNDLTCALSTEENKKMDIQLYPNPNNGKFILSGLEENDVIEISDTYGKRLKYVRYKNEISSKDFPSGMYFIKIYRQRQTIVLKTCIE